LGKIPKADGDEQAEKREWNYNLKTVWRISILDFAFDDYENSWKSYQDLKGKIDTAVEEGKLETTKSQKLLGIEINSVAKSTGLSKKKK
jgi:hypothetical protein